MCICPIDRVSLKNFVVENCSMLLNVYLIFKRKLLLCRYYKNVREDVKTTGCSLNAAAGC